MEGPWASVRHIFNIILTLSAYQFFVTDCLIVKFGWKDEDKDRMRLPFTIVPIFCSVVLSIAPLPGKHYNYNGIFFCDITSSPLGCDREGSTTQCTADSIDMLLWVGIVPFMVAFVIIVCAMVVLAYSVLKQERTMDRYRREGEGVNRNMTTQTSLQGMCYIAAFGVCWIPWCICECSEGMCLLLLLLKISHAVRCLPLSLGCCVVSPSPGSVVGAGVQ